MVAPAIRGTVVKSVLAAVERLPPSAREGVLAGVRGDTLKTIRGESGVSWIPSATWTDLCDAAFRKLGAQGYEALWAALFVELTRGPLLRPLVEGAMTLFGSTPGSLARRAPAGWSLITRGMGTFRVEDAGEGRVRLLVEGYPDEDAASGAWLHGFAGTFHGFFSLTRTQGTVDFTSSGGKAEYVIAWHATP